MSSRSGESDRYVFDHQWQQARRRLTSLEEAYDPATVRRLEGVGVGPGWNCLEVGAGAGSVARWLARRVGPSGRVVAADLDVDLLGDVSEPNIEVRRVDLRDDDLPADTFDLVHTRFVLGHIPARERILDSLIAAVRPGGWIVLEEADSFATAALDDGLHPRVLNAILDAVTGVGFARNWGRELVSLFRERGLGDIGVACEVPILEGGSPGLEWLRLTADQVLNSGLSLAVSGDELGEWRDLMDRPGQWHVGLSAVATWGRRV